jgi:hydroxyacylglutathione hydrolase
VARIVAKEINEWLSRNNRESISLIVAHTHAHDDHTSGDGQLKALSHTIVVEPKTSAVQAFFGFRNWPTEVATYDLWAGSSRLVDFTQGKIVTHLLGNHIEQTRTAYLDYPVGTIYRKRTVVAVWEKCG